MVCCAAALTGCATPRPYEDALSDAHDLRGNSCAVIAAPDKTFQAVTATFIQKGFNIEQADASTRLIKATRNYTDPKKTNVNYHIAATAYIGSAGPGSTVMLSASQETVLHKSGHNWKPLPLVGIPIPVGRKNETVTTGEGGIESQGFYQDFFIALKRTLVDTSAVPVASTAGTTAPAAASASPSTPTPESATASIPATHQ
jgi:hypothetical protein